MKYGLLVLGLCLTMTANAALKVVATIAPLQSLAMAVAEGAFVPERLIAPNISPHHFTLRPSEAKKLLLADLVLTIAPEYETGLRAFLSRLLQDKQWAAIEVPGLTLYPWQGQHEHAEEEAHHHHHEAGFDTHLWLDITNAQKIVQNLANRFAQLDPKNAALYAKNAEQTSVRLRQLDTTIEGTLKQQKIPPFVVYHDGYQYFAKRYGLTVLGTLVTDPELPASGKHLSEMRRMILEHNVHCIFSEPQFPAPLVEKLASELKLKVGLLDPLGVQFADSSNSYENTIQQLAKAVSECHAQSHAPR